MFQPIYSPLEYYLNDAKPRHAQAVREAIAQHLRDHPVDRAQNAATVKSYEEKQAKANATQKTIKKYKRLRGWGIVSNDGYISWTNDKGLTNPETVYIKGPKGDKGDSPVKGTDYWTDADKTEIVNNVLASLPDGDEVSY